MAGQATIRMLRNDGHTLVAGKLAMGQEVSVPDHVAHDLISAGSAVQIRQVTKNIPTAAKMVVLAFEP